MDCKNIMIRYMHEKRGLSLVELLVAVAILVAGLVPMLSVFLYALQTTERSNKITIAANLARDLAEEIRSRAFWEPELSGSAVYFPIGTSQQPFGPEETFVDGNQRLKQFDDVDDYDFWCRGQDCDCSNLPAGYPTDMCKQGWPLETYEGDKYNGTGGYPNYPGFTRKVEVFNIYPSHTSPVPTHTMTLRKGTSDTDDDESITFEFYDLQEENFPNLTGGATGKTRLKVIKVTVGYKGSVTGDIEVNDINLVAMPITETP